MQTPTPKSKQAKHILKKVFGYDTFRPLQADIIANVLGKKDTLVIMPTGGGKSLCYQIPALMFEGLTIVVSPLISLMKDQVEQLMELGVSVVLLNSSLPPQTYSENITKIKQNQAKLLYIAPESLLKPDILNMLSTVRIDCLTIDEAHCISEWGHDFRPEYRQLVNVRARFPDAVCMALTATATPPVREDIKKSLKFTSSNEFIDSFNRENLFITIVQKTDPVKQTLAFIKTAPDQSGIIYCFTRKQVEDLYEILEAQGFSVRPYHAGLSDAERKQNQELFIRDDIQIIVATIAFGMGINKPNVRFVIHYDLPKNIEGYYQEIGRAGRDGLRSECLLLFSYADTQKIRHFINQKDGHEKRVATIQLNALLQFVETETCRRIPLLTYFGDNYTATKCNMCDNCLKEEKTPDDITILAQKFLSCVKRTGETFGAAHIIDVLRGSEAKKVLKFNHQRLSTYGIGNDLSKNEWTHLSRQFLHQGLVTQDMDYGGLKLTEKAWAVLKNSEPVLGHLYEKPAGPEKAHEPKRKDDYEYDTGLFNKLRQKRKELADIANVPPYIIFSDKTLMEMAAFFPQSLNSLRNIYGIGEEKLKKYGFPFLDIICDHCDTHFLKEKPKNKPSAPSKIPRQTKQLRHIAVGDAYNAGQSIARLMAAYSVKQITIVDHLYRYSMEGRVLRPDGLFEASSVPPDRQALVFKAFKTLGTDSLSPVYESLNKEISYNELKLLRLYYMSDKAATSL